MMKQGGPESYENMITPRNVSLNSSLKVIFSNRLRKWRESMRQMRMDFTLEKDTEKRERCNECRIYAQQYTNLIYMSILSLYFKTKGFWGFGEIGRAHV